MKPFVFTFLLAVFCISDATCQHMENPFIRPNGLNSSWVGSSQQWNLINDPFIGSGAANRHNSATMVSLSLPEINKLTPNQQIGYGLMQLGFNILTNGRWGQSFSNDPYLPAPAYYGE